MNFGILVTIFVLIGISLAGCVTLEQMYPNRGVEGKYYCTETSPTRTCAEFYDTGDYLFYTSTPTDRIVRDTLMVGTWYQGEHGRYIADYGNYSGFFHSVNVSYRTVWICETVNCERVHEEGNPVIFGFNDYLPDIGSD